jgi:hypothetical protein
MAGNANLSSTFSITFVPTNAADTVISNTMGRAFKIIAILCNNPTAGAVNVNVQKNVGGVLTAITQGGNFSALANTGTVADINLTDNEIGATDGINIQCAAATVSVQVICTQTAGGTPLQAV